MTSAESSEHINHTETNETKHVTMYMYASEP